MGTFVSAKEKDSVYVVKRRFGLEDVCATVTYLDCDSQSFESFICELENIEVHWDDSGNKKWSL